MVTGYNVNVKHAGAVYHVQTEDRGRKNPTIETLIYFGGKIIHQEKYSYADRNGDKYNEAEVKILLDQQHERLIAEVRANRFNPDRRPFGEEFMTDRTLDQCILDFLAEQSAGHTLTLTVVSQEGFLPGETGTLVVKTSHQDTGKPIAGASIRGRMIYSNAGPAPLADVKTDQDGVASLQFPIPADEQVNAALIVVAESEFGFDQMQRAVC